MNYNIRKIWNPDWFQGNNRRRNYFEGWYFKMVSADHKSIISVIPGISIGRSKQDAYAFIQLINGKTGETEFIRFPFESFSYSRKQFSVTIGKNKFSADRIELDIDQDGLKIKGSVEMNGHVPYPVKLFSPGVMGWYRFVPTMECYHGILSMQHELVGQLSIKGTDHDFQGGKGYIEKDWGKSMPLSWIWIQSNHFEKQEISASISIANIPWKRSAFTGFLIILYAENKIIRFTTYTGAKIRDLEYKDDRVKFIVQKSDYTLKVEAIGSDRGILKAPVLGEMSREIKESINSTLKLELADEKGNILFSGTGHPAGMEVAGETSLLISKLAER